jgi:hypothetical protein
MNRTRTAVALSVATVLGVAALAGCSSSSSSTTSSSASSAAATSAASAAASVASHEANESNTEASTEASAAASSVGGNVLPPIMIATDATTADCKVGDKLYFQIDDKKLAGTTVSSADEAIVTVTQATQQDDATMTAGGECVAAGSTTVTVTSPDGSTRAVAVTVTQ